MTDLSRSLIQGLPEVIRLFSQSNFMWTKADAVAYVIREELPIAKIRTGMDYVLDDELTEEWEAGWVLNFTPVGGDGLWARYLIEKEMEKCVIIGSAGVSNAIEHCYGFLAGGCPPKKSG